MRAVHVLHYAGPPTIGGVEITIAHHARLLTERGFRVQVIAGQGEAFHPKVAFLQIPEAGSRHPEVLAVGEELAAGKVTPRFESLRARLREALRAAVSPQDVFIVHNALTLHKNLPLTAALHDLAAEGYRLIGWCHDFAWLDELYIPQLHPGFPWDLLRTPWRNTRYVVVSEHRRGQLARLLGIAEDEIAVVPPGVAPEQLLRLSPGPPGPHNPTNAAYLAQLRSLRAELGLENSVHFLYEHGEGGEPLLIDDAMMAEWYALADALLFPSLREGFGMPVLEAGLVRLPVLAADIPPVRESANDTATLFDPQGDPAEAAARIAERLRSDPIYRLHRRVLNHFTWDAIIDNLVIPLLTEHRST